MIYFVGYLITCWIAADFLSGFYHWLEDRYAKDDWPIIGKHIAKPNKFHHQVPSAFLASSYWTRNWTTFAVALPVFAMTFPNKWCLIFAMVSQANEVHAWTHQKCNRLIRAAQSTGILQSPREHGLHHRTPFDCRYCAMSNWLNPFLDESGFWLLLEFIVEKTTGIKPFVVESQGTVS